jgi:hypothetical protein
MTFIIKIELILKHKIKQIKFLFIHQMAPIFIFKIYFRVLSKNFASFSVKHFSYSACPFLIYALLLSS